MIVVQRPLDLLDIPAGSSEYMSVHCIYFLLLHVRLLLFFFSFFICSGYL